jgi:hypothetical protein
MRFKRKKKKRKRGQFSIWLVILPATFSVLTYFWITGAAFGSQFPPKYSPPDPDSPQEPVNYSALIDRHSINQSLLDNPLVRGFVAFGAHSVTFATLILHAEPKRSAVMLFLLAPGSLIAAVGLCGGCAAITLPTAHTQLDHLDTAKFDGHVYHLALATGIDSGLLDELYVFECDLSGETCVFLDEILPPNTPKLPARSQSPEEARFIVDNNGRRLHVQANGTVYFSLEAQSDPPDEFALPLYRAHATHPWRKYAAFDAIRHIRL